MSKNYIKEKSVLAQKVTYILDQLNLVWTINGKTLQGANNNGQSLEDDMNPFDIVIYQPILLHSHIKEDKLKLLKLYMNQINYLLQEPYISRIIPSLGYIIEIFDPTYKKMENDVYYSVSCKLTLLVHETSDILQLQSIPYDNKINTLDFLPLSLIEYEGCIYQAPGNTSKYLKSIEKYLNLEVEKKGNHKINVINFKSTSKSN
jgi:hypothetical protein